MALKREAVKLPTDLTGKRVLDVGSDMGAWCFEAADRGAKEVFGLDRNREVKNIGPVDLISLNENFARISGRKQCRFVEINIGKQWREFGRFDLVLVLSVYHHIFENCGDHRAIWFWLSRHCTDCAEIIWEGPVDDSDPVVRANVSEENRRQYDRNAILTAASEFFSAEYVGPALHETTREVWRFKSKKRPARITRGKMVHGAGGATAAFEYEGNRRIKEIEDALGFWPFPGSLNVELDGPFDWDSGYYRAQIHDVVGRGCGLDVEWKLRWARFYPLMIDGLAALAFRFEGEKYGHHFMEVIAPERLRDRIAGVDVTICR